MDNNYNIEIIRSNRKTIGLEVRADGRVLVRAPLRADAATINQMIKSHEGWIIDKLKKVNENKQALEKEKIRKLTREELEDLARRASRIIPKKVFYFSKIVGVSYGRITIRNQSTIWGSCTKKGNLNFNCMLILAPEEIIDYVVVHELCHRKEMNHSKAFWQQVENVLPDYKSCEKWLKENGSLIMAQNPAKRD